jgi:hypothetical protein
MYRYLRFSGAQAQAEWAAAIRQWGADAVSSAKHRTRSPSDAAVWLGAPTEEGEVEAEMCGWLRYQSFCLALHWSP